MTTIEALTQLIKTLTEKHDCCQQAAKDLAVVGNYADALRLESKATGLSFAVLEVVEILERLKAGQQ